MNFEIKTVYFILFYSLLRIEGSPRLQSLKTDMPGQGPKPRERAERPGIGEGPPAGGQREGEKERASDSESDAEGKEEIMTRIERDLKAGRNRKEAREKGRDGGTEGRRDGEG